MAEYQIKQPNGESKTKNFEYYPLITDKLDNLYKKEKIELDDLYQITLWKVSRFPFSDIEDPSEILNILNSLKEKKYNEEDSRRVLAVLLKEKGVGLPMASTYLRFINPDAYQIIDRHAYRAAYNYQKIYPSTEKKAEELIKIYFDYLEELRKIAKNSYHGYTVAFKNLDRFLYDVDRKSRIPLNEKDEKKVNASEEKIIEWINLVINEKDQ